MKAYEKINKEDNRRDALVLTLAPQHIYGQKCKGKVWFVSFGY